jgi:prevent-host-death family protein
MAVAPSSVGIRELRRSLAAYLARVQDGEEVVVTDRGKPVARLVPIDRSADRLAELVAMGLARPPLRPRTPLGPLIETDGTVSDLVAEQRR